MTDHLSPSIQKVAHSYIDGERFTTSSEVLLFSLDLLNAFEKHYQARLGQEVKQALEQFDHGEHTVFFSPKDVDDFFDDIAQAGRLNHAEHR